MMQVHHVYPRGGGNDTSGTACWCRPVFKRLCQQCGGKGEGCWACDDGLVMCLEDEAQMVVHNDTERP